MPAKHQIRRLTAMAFETPWAITPAKLQVIVDLLDRRGEGHLSREEIDARLAGLRRSVILEEEEAKPYRLVNGVAVVPLYGVLGPRMNFMMDYSGGTSTQDFAAAVMEAAGDPEVRAIVLDVDSPGGSVLGTPEAAEAVALAAAEKTMVAVATGQMCSAAYWIGAAAGRIAATPSSQVGSIGVYQVHSDYSARDTTAGVRRTVIHAGTRKTVGNPHETLDQNKTDDLRGEVEDYYEMFVAAVAKYRGVSVEKVEASFGQGAAMVAARAKQAGLIDAVGTLSEVVSELAGAGGTQPETRSRPIGAAHRTIVVSQTKEPAMANEVSPQNQTQTPAVSAPTASAAAQTPATAPTVVLQTQAAEAARPDPAAIAAAERERIVAIQTSGQLLGVEQTTIDAAVASGTPLLAFLDQATQAMASREKPVRGAIQPGPASADKFSQAATEAMLHRGGRGGNKPLSAEAKPLQYASLLDIARESLRVTHNRAVLGSPDQIARAALGDREVLRDMGIYGADVPYHSPGDFPNLLSNLAGKALDSAMRYRGTTFQFWARQRESLADFKPSNLVRIGEFGELPVVPDGSDFEQSSTGEEYSWIAVDTYGDEFAFTPRMMVDDDLGGLMDSLSDKQAAADMTLNRLCVNLLTGNPLWTDGVALFAAGHSNLVALGVGAAPSQVTLTAARLALRTITGINGRRQLNYNVEGLLVPAALEGTTELLLNPNVRVIPVTTATGEIYRGQVKWWVEPMLDTASATGWYAFADQDIARCIVYAYMRGFERVQKRDYYNPKNNCRIFQFEQRMAAAVNTHRGVYFNAGA